MAGEVEMTCPVDVYQNPGELAELLTRMQPLAPKRILEIGSLYGGTLWHWMSAFPGATVVSLDAIAFGVPEHPIGKIMTCREKWEDWAQEFGCELHSFTDPSESDAALNHVGEFAPFDFVFVDGGHAYSYISADFLNYYPMVRDGGLMAFHDIAYPDNTPGIDVGTWWRELKASQQYRMEEISYLNGSWGIGLIWKTL